MQKYLGFVLGVSATLLPVAGLIAASPANATQWVRIITTDDGDIFYVDRSTITGKGQFRYFWKNIVFPRPSSTISGRSVYGHLTYESVNCSTMIYRRRILEALDANGRTIRRWNDGDSGDLEVAFPETMQDAVLNYVCSQRR